MTNHLNLPTAEIQREIADALKIIASQHKPTDYSGSPGNNFLIAGDRNAGFYGFVQPKEFGKIASNPEESQEFNGVNLALALGLTNGNAINSDSAWMKFSWKGKVLFVPVKPLRHSITWEAIYNAGAVYGDDTIGTLPPKGRMGAGEELAIDATTNSFTINPREADKGFLYGSMGAVGDTIVSSGWQDPANNGEFTIQAITDTSITVTGGQLVTETAGKNAKIYNKSSTVTQNAKVKIGDKEYRVRLLKGAASDPIDSWDDADGGSVGPENEWNGLILPLHEKARLGNWNYKAFAGDVPDWNVGLTDGDLITHHTQGYGNYTWCQEVSDATSYKRVYRGYRGTSGFFNSVSWIAGTSHGWRPCLELL